MNNTDWKMNEFSTYNQTDPNIINSQCAFITDFNKYNNSKNIDGQNELEKENENILDKESSKEIDEKINTSDVYDPKKISNLFEKNEKLVNIKDKFESDLIDDNIQKEMAQPLIKKKRKRRRNAEIEKERNEMEKNKDIIHEEKKIGRLSNKNKNDNLMGKHNKFSTDNIMKKVKSFLFRYLIIAINLIIPQECKQYHLKKLNYDYINQIKKDKEISYLNMTIRDLLSLEISPKYSIIEKNFNQKNIEKILEISNTNVDMNKIFNMTFRDWIDIFTLKKKSDIIIEGIDKLLEEVYEKNKYDKHYFSLFVYCLYNYEKWFDCKQSRNSKKKND